MAFAFKKPGTFFHPKKNPKIKKREQRRIKNGILLFKIFFGLTLSFTLLKIADIDG
jgi:hypothetical protein